MRKSSGEFEVQHSTDGKAWRVITFETSKGNSEQINYYEGLLTNKDTPSEQKITIAYAFFEFYSIFI